MDEQRQKTLQAHISSNKLRPILISLNGDNSWLMSFPRPSSERTQTGRAYYHVVFEPWLNGPTGFLSPWVIHIAQTSIPALATPESIKGVIADIETAAGTTNAGTCDIDAIFMGFHYDDHLHPATLKLFDPSIPVIATPEATATLKSLKHFTTILPISNLPLDAKSWTSPSLHPGTPFPSWLTPLRLPGHHELNYITALIWTHHNPTGEPIYESILQTPHGLNPSIPFPAFDTFLSITPRLTQNLALLHGLKESSAMGSMNTFGAKSGLHLHRRLGGVKYWIPTHNSQLTYSGIVMRVLGVADTERSVEWALEEEGKSGGGDGEERGTPEVVTVENGGMFVLS